MDSDRDTMKMVMDVKDIYERLSRLEEQVSNVCDNEIPHISIRLEKLEEMIGNLDKKVSGILIKITIAFSIIAFFAQLLIGEIIKRVPF